MNWLIFRCKTCGQQWLSPSICCDAESIPASLQIGSFAESNPTLTAVDLSLIFVIHRLTPPVLQRVATIQRELGGKSLELILAGTSQFPCDSQLIRTLAKGPLVRVLRLPARTGLSRIYNLAAQSARGRYLVLAQSSVQDFQLRLLNRFAVALNDPRVGLVGTEQYPQQHHDLAPASQDSRYCFSHESLPGTIVGLRAETFWEVGGLDESFKTFAVASQDLQYRLICANYRLASTSVPAGKPVQSTSTQRLPDLRSDQKRFATKYRRRLTELGNSRQLFAGHQYPKLSVAIATRNYGRWLRRCLDSVLKSANSETALQVVVTDDCSTDETQLILESYRNKYPGVISTVRPRTSAGVPLAKNLAMRRSIGPYIALHDADDEFYRQKVRRCMRTLEAKPGIDLLTHDYRFIDSVTGETFVPGDDWFGDWRPPGVWVPRAGLVNFNEQMVCGYEELEWAMRFWPKLRRVHVAATLTKVHGQYVHDRWKVDRDIAGLQSMNRWRKPSLRSRGPFVFACEGCGNQYFNQIRCCTKLTLEVPLVCYMAIASASTNTPVEFSIVVFTRNSLAETRKLVSAWREVPEARRAEWVFVGCNPRAGLLKYFRELSRETKMKVVFSPVGQPSVYSHDANRAVRCADGSILLFLETAARPQGTESLSLIRQALARSRVGIVGVALDQEETGTANTTPLSRACYGLRRDVFWELGAMDERFDGDGLEVIDLQYRALRCNYHLLRANLTLALRASETTYSTTDRRYFLQKIGLRRRKTWSPTRSLAHLKSPEISVAIATHNEARFLPRCLDSVRRAIEQAGVPVQVVVVNDCSTDETRLVLEQYRQRFPALTVLHNERRLGPARAHNQALARCAGTYVACLDAKDLFRPAKLRKCLFLLGKSGADFLFHDVVGGTQYRHSLTRAPISTWMFQDGVLRFNEQIVTGHCQTEWLKQQAHRLKTVYLPLRLTQQGKRMKAEEER